MILRAVSLALLVIDGDGALFNYLVAYVATAVTMLAIDMVWLGLIAKSLYRAGIGHLMAESPNLMAAGAFYLLYPIGLLAFAVMPSESPLLLLIGASTPLARAVAGGALFGFFAYVTYDLSNLATLKSWPLRLTLIDIAWGTLVSAMAAGAGRWTLDRWF